MTKAALEVFCFFMVKDWKILYDRNKRKRSAGELTEVSNRV